MLLIPKVTVYPSQPYHVQMLQLHNNIWHLNEFGGNFEKAPKHKNFLSIILYPLLSRQSSGLKKFLLAKFGNRCCHFYVCRICRCTDYTI